MEILNLYACLGGNRYKWEEVNPNIKVTAVELDEECARLYKERFPQDTVIVADAHQYLIENFKKYDFVWSSPPCPTHSKIRMSQINRNGFENKYADLKLYEEILLLQYQYDGLFVVENVIPYYKPLIPAKQRSRHLYWTNFELPNPLPTRKFKGGIGEGKNEVQRLCEYHEFDFYKYKGNQRLNKIARNLVDYTAGKAIFQAAINSKKKQVTLFE